MDTRCSHDPFEIHFSQPDLQESDLSAVKTNRWQWNTSAHPSLGKVEEALPETSDAPSRKRKFTDADFGPIASVSDLPLKKRLVEAAETVLSNLPMEMRTLAVPIFEYRDVQYGSRTPYNADHIRKLTALHALNHIYKTRDRILRNNERVRAAETAANDKASVPDDIRDQGFTRPKVLILLETCSMAYKYAEAFIQLAQPAQQENKSRFESKFGTPKDEQPLDQDLPADYRELFSGNSENNFLATLKFTRKTLKFFPSFADADIILASAPALNHIIYKIPKKPNYDFLSSIELLVIDQADAMLHQNFELVHTVCEQLNRPLRTMNTTTDYSRVREWYLDDHARHVRQTLLFSAYHTPELNGLAEQKMRSVRGRLRISPPAYAGQLSAARAPIKQVFSRFDAVSPAAMDAARLGYLTKTTLPGLHRRFAGLDAAPGLLLLAPTYYDFVQLRAHLLAHRDALPCAFACLDERADVAAARRARSLFAQRRVGALLYSGRAHHFRRYNIKGIRRAVLYGVPENPAFYAEVLQMLARSVAAGEARPDEVDLQVIYSKFEVMALERVVGSERVGKMVYGKKRDVFEFTP